MERNRYATGESINLNLRGILEGVEEICKKFIFPPGQKLLFFFIYRKKECSNIIDMFITRGMMHDKAYQHVKVKIIEEMVLDAFSHAKEKLNLTDCDTRNILKLTDHIYYKIIHDDSHGDEGFQNAKEILLRVQKRDLYLCIANVEIKVKILNLIS